MFVFLCVVHAFVLFIQQNYILTEEVYYHSLGEQLTIDRIDKILEQKTAWEWIGYALIPLTLFFQALLITICLNTATLLLEYKVKFRQLFGMTVKALVIFAFAKVIYIFLANSIDIQTFDDLKKVDYFSLLGLIGREGIPEWLQYPLEVINVFQAIFWLLLAAGLGYLLKKPTKNMISLVASSYGTGLVIWVLFIVFMLLQLS